MPGICQQTLAFYSHKCYRLLIFFVPYETDISIIYVLFYIFCFAHLRNGAIPSLFNLFTDPFFVTVIDIRNVYVYYVL